MPSFQKKIENVQQSIITHYTENEGYLAWSGGLDSTALLFLTLQVIPNIPVVWFNSGLEYPETVKYVNSLVKEFRINFDTINATPDALTILKNTGAWDHSATYNRDVENMHNILITEPALKAHQKYGLGELTGLRADESAGRRVLLSKNDGHYVRADGSKVYAPLWAWNQNDIEAVFDYYKVTPNPVYNKLEKLGVPKKAQRVGLMVDGNNPNYGRYTYLRQGWPEIWAELTKILPRLNEWR